MTKLKLIAIATIAFAFSAKTSFAEAVKYQIEPNHTYAVWFANHFGFSSQSGKFSDVSGEIVFDEAKPANSSVDVTIKIASLVTGLAKFDQHLKSADFFDAEKFPTAKFVSKKIKVTGKDKSKIEGDLTIGSIEQSNDAKVTFDCVQVSLFKNDIAKFSEEMFSFLNYVKLTRLKYRHDHLDIYYYYHHQTHKVILMTMR